jgi:hypothetical protein
VSVFSIYETIFEILYLYFYFVHILKLSDRGITLLDQRDYLFYSIWVPVSNGIIIHYRTMFYFIFAQY